MKDISIYPVLPFDVGPILAHLVENTKNAVNMSIRSGGEKIINEESVIIMIKPKEGDNKGD